MTYLPLSYLLGSRAKVDIIRILVNKQNYTGRKIAVLSSTNPNSNKKALDFLMETGLVLREQVGNAYHYNLNSKHFLYEPITTLFKEEEKTINKIMKCGAAFIEEFAPKTLAGFVSYLRSSVVLTVLAHSFPLLAHAYHSSLSWTNLSKTVVCMEHIIPITLCVFKHIAMPGAIITDIGPVDDRLCRFTPWSIWRRCSGNTYSIVNIAEVIGRIEQIVGFTYMQYRRTFCYTPTCQGCILPLLCSMYTLLSCLFFYPHQVVCHLCNKDAITILQSYMIKISLAIIIKEYIRIYSLARSSNRHLILLSKRT